MQIFLTPTDSDGTDPDIPDRRTEQLPSSRRHVFDITSKTLNSNLKLFLVFFRHLSNLFSNKMNKPPQEVPIDYDDPKYRITPVQQAAASCTGALLTSLIMTPLDVVKIRIQAQQTAMKDCFLYCNGLMDHICSCRPTDRNNPWYKRPGEFTGTFDAFVQIGRNEGVTSLWSGLSPTLVLSVPATICYFVTYEQLRLKLKESYNKNKGPQELAKQPYWIPLLSGATARVVSVTIVNPIELIRTKMQSERLSYSEIGEALKKLVKTDGIKGLWKGIVPTLLRDVPFSALYWMSYESIKTWYRCDHPNLWQSFTAGAISGSIAATVTVPFDVVKTHQQIEFGSTLFSDDGKQVPQKSRTTSVIFFDIYKQHGIRGLYAGLTPRLIKVAPACAIMISSFEYGKVFFNRLANQSLLNKPNSDDSVVTRRIREL